MCRTRCAQSESFAMPTGQQDGSGARKRCRFRIHFYPRVKVRCVDDAGAGGGSWERMQGQCPGPGAGKPNITGCCNDASKGGSSSSPPGFVTTRFRRSRPRPVLSQKRRMKTLRLGGSRRARLQQSLGDARRWVVSASGWAGVAFRSKAKVGLTFLREALKLLITGLHAPSSEMSMGGYHIGPYLDEVLMHRRLEMHKMRRSKSMSFPADAAQRKAENPRSSSKSAAAPHNQLPRGWNRATERIITFPGSQLARRHAPHKGLATIAESALESEVRI